jgi:hypothetical protein
MLPHRIRLRGPWQAGALTVRLPEQFAQLPRQPVTLTRHFGWPAPLGAHERVWLIFDQLTTACDARLNDQPLGIVEREFEITPLLRERNELRIDLPAGARWDEIAIEVRGQAWLSDVSARRHGERLILRGRLDGTADGRLDLYAIMERRTAIQAALDAPGPFELTSEPVEHWATEAHVELVHGSTVWHAADVPVAEN